MMTLRNACGAVSCGAVSAPNSPKSRRALLKAQKLSQRGMPLFDEWGEAIIYGLPSCRYGIASVPSCGYGIASVPSCGYGIASVPSCGYGIASVPTIVRIQGKDFTWKEGEGLDPEVVGTLEGWIVKTANAYAKAARENGHDFDDLRQTARVAALEAARTYDPRKGMSYLGWANYKISKALGRMSAPCRNVSLDTGLCDDQIAACDLTSQWDAALEADKVLGRLSKYDRTLLAAYFGINGHGGKSMREVAKRYKVSQGAVRLLIHRALMRARERVL